MKKKLGIYDEVAYSYRLMQRLNQELPSGFMVYSFSEEVSFKEFLDKEKPDILLVGEAYYSEDMVSYDGLKLIILAESNENMNSDFEGSIYKYQPVSKIVKQLNVICGNDAKTIEMTENGVRFVGVYSPVRRCGKTSLSIAISKIFSRKQKVLYLNFEAFPATFLPERNNDVWNLSDVFYFMEQKRAASEILNNAIIDYNGISVITPGDVPMDLQEINKEKWEQFFMMLSDLKPVDVVVIDFDESISCYVQLLELCERIYCPVLHDNASVEKMKIFEDFLAKSGYDSIKDKIEKFDYRISEAHNSNSYEQMVEQFLDR